jgi:hypothetical protein
MISPKTILLLSIILGVSMCHDDHSHGHTHSYIPTQPAVAVNPLHTHYYNGSATPATGPSELHTHYYNPAATPANPTSNLHTHYYDPAAAAAAANPTSNLHTHYWTNERPAPVPAPTPAPSVVNETVIHEHRATAFTPVNLRPGIEAQRVEIVGYKAPIINRKPLDTRPIQYKREPLPYLPGYKWNNYTMRREE